MTLSQISEITQICENARKQKMNVFVAVSFSDLIKAAFSLLGVKRGMDLFGGRTLRFAEGGMVVVGTAPRKEYQATYRV